MLEQAIGTLIENNMNVNQNETDGMNVLTHLFRSGQTTKILEISNILIEKRKNVNHTGKDDWNALMLIIRYS